MFSAVKVAKSARAIVPDPSLLADALLAFEVELAVGRTVGQTLPGLLVQLGTVRPLPALLADAGAVHAEPVA